ncbi:MAG: hypothetical protein ACXIVL_00110 [Oceanicaulis sp.]
MTDPVLLHAGFDGLDLAYRVTLPKELLRALEVAHADAIDARRAVALTYRDQTFLVNGHGGRGGYAFAIDTGVMGANWWFKRPGTGDRWGARVSSRSLPLALKGIEAVKAEHDQFLITLGMTFGEIDRRISRIDYALDFYLPDFEFNPSHFVTHAKRSKSLDIEMATDYRGEKLNGIRIGKMPNAQIAIYDKRREVLDKKKHYWWDIWKENANSAGIVLSNKSPIWRFEFRAGKMFLEKSYQRKTWEAFTANPGLAFQRIAAQTRLASPQDDMNRARWHSALVWGECQKQLGQITLQYISNADPNAIKQALFAEYLDTIGKQTVGLIVSQMAVYGLNISDLTAMTEQIQLDVESAIRAQGMPPDSFLKSRAATAATKYGR